MRTRTLLILAAWLSGVTVKGEYRNQQDPVTQLLTQGTAATQAGDLPKAEEYFQKAAAAAPQLSDAFLGLGLVQLRRGELDTAIKSLTRATQLNDQLLGAHLFLGITQYQAGQPVQAETSLQAELSLDGNSVEALRWLGIVALELDHPAEAVQYFNHLAMLRPADSQVLYYQAHALQMAAKAALSKLYALDPDSAFVHRALAESLSEAGQPEKAIAEFNAALRKDPSNPDVLEELGTEEQKLSHFDEATAVYQKELKFNPNSAIAFYNLGRIDVERGKPAEGVNLLRHAHAAHASAAPTAFYLGLGLAELGENAEAVQWLERALAGQPSAFIQKGAWYQLARVYAKLHRPLEQQNALAHLKQFMGAPDRANDEKK